MEWVCGMHQGGQFHAIVDVGGFPDIALCAQFLGATALQLACVALVLCATIGAFRRRKRNQAFRQLVRDDPRFGRPSGQRRQGSASRLARSLRGGIGSYGGVAIAESGSAGDSSSRRHRRHRHSSHRRRRTGGSGPHSLRDSHSSASSHASAVRNAGGAWRWIQLPTGTAAVCIMASACLAAALSHNTHVVAVMKSPAFSPAMFFALGTSLALWNAVLAAVVATPSVCVSDTMLVVGVCVGIVGSTRMHTCVISAMAGYWSMHFPFWASQTVCAGFAGLVGIAAVGVIVRRTARRCRYDALRLVLHAARRRVLTHVYAEQAAVCITLVLGPAHARLTCPWHAFIVIIWFPRHDEC